MTCVNLKLECWMFEPTKSVLSVCETAANKAFSCWGVCTKLPNSNILWCNLEIIIVGVDYLGG